MAMDLRATKTHSEREDEETSRLVRPAPKYKPPRRDRRRESIDPDRDPDIDDDPDIKKDPDRSRNYKNIGGSFTHAIVAARFIAAKGRKIKVRHRDTGKVVLVSEDTLKEEGGKYEKIDEAEGKEPEGPEDAEAAKRGDALRSMAKGDEKLEGVFKSLLNQKSDLGGLAHGNPNLPAKAVFKDIQLPEGVETLGDLVKALRSKPSKAKPEQKAPEQKAPEQKAPEQKAPEQKAPEAEKPEATETEAPKTEPAKSPDQTLPSAGNEEAPKEAPKEQPAEAGESSGEKGDAKPAKKKKAPPREPTEAEKAGIKPPKRRAASEAERMDALNLIIDSFPEDVATELIAKNLHPDDVNRLVGTYHATKQLPLKDPAAFAEKTSGFYETDPDKVPPPAKGKNAAGKLVPFKELSPEEQSETMREHQIQVTALSLGAKEALTKSLSSPSWTGSPRIPHALASSLATFMLHKGDEKAAQGMADEMFSSALTNGTTSKIDDKAAAKLLENLTPGAKKLATAYLEAGDYEQAKDKFLGGGEDQISEHSSPAEIMGAMRDAKKFFASRGKAYGDAGHRAKSIFQVRVLDRLRALAPKKYGEVRKLMAEDQKADFDRQKSAYDKAFKQWEARKKAWEGSQGYRDQAFDEPPPKEPKKPALYHLAEDPKQSRRQAEAAIDEVLGRSKTAGRLFIFTYPGTHAMGSGSDRTGVYHGIDPLKNYPKAYPEWQQAHQRDLGEGDFTTILGAAKEWLKSAVLTHAIEGITRDQQLRAALDLAIQDSKYARQIQPTLYNKLLARLAGVPGPGLNQTLLTIREANSSFGSSKKGTTMKPSNELRKLAAKAADTDPKLAFEMIELAETMERQATAPVAPGQKTASAPMPDERYSKLRALTIRTAAVDAGAKRVLLPLLQEIKNLG